MRRGAPAAALCDRMRVLKITNFPRYSAPDFLQYPCERGNFSDSKPMKTVIPSPGGIMNKVADRKIYIEKPK
jgi:hypothetical protein